MESPLLLRYGDAMCRVEIMLESRRRKQLCGYRKIGTEHIIGMCKKGFPILVCEYVLCELIFLGHDVEEFKWLQISPPRLPQ